MAKRKAPTHRLGEEVFCVQENGRIVRTAISEVGESDPSRIFGGSRRKPSGPGYALLNGSSGPHFFALDQAISAAERTLHTRIASDGITKAEEQKARDYLKSLRTAAFEEALRAEPIVEGAKLSGFIPEKRYRKDPVFPTEYFLPGQAVYAIITPSDHDTGYRWRPYPYFLLKTRVEKVSFSPKWEHNVFYGIGSSYTVQHSRLCATLAEGREKFAKIFSKETGGTIAPDKIRCVSVSAERVARKKQMEALFKHHGL